MLTLEDGRNVIIKHPGQIYRVQLHQACSFHCLLADQYSDIRLIKVPMHTGILVPVCIYMGSISI